MKYVKTLGMVCIFVFSFSVSAQADVNKLAVGIASDHIDVTVGFTGSSIELFGDRRDKNSVVAIVVEGPRKNITIWKKARVMGAWINRHYANFEDIPSYYHHAISAEKVDEKLERVMMENGIGHKALFEASQNKEAKKQDNIEIFQDALLEKKGDLGVFFKEPAKFTFLNDNFFRVSFDIPPSSSTGEYKIRSFLIKNGKVIDTTLNLLKVEQVGLNAFITKSARDYSFIYAFTCVFLAVFSGWLVSALRVRP